MTERRARPARDHGRHPRPLIAEARVPDRVDPPVDPVQPSGADAPRDTTLCQTSAGQLPKPDYSMLCRGNLRHKRVGPGAL